MEIFAVGGFVRDHFLGIPASDKDYVVVGSTPEEMISSGFTPVGNDFPVFLHPTTKEEYALARTERKNGKGYAGFICYASPEVTLEQDLGRRDLTINAMAMSDTGMLIDPYNGIVDLKNKVLRHVGESFKEDPLRILRLARFAARYSDFTIDSATIDFCKDMVAAGEVDHLVPERVWKELSKGLMENAPSKMFEVLYTVGALQKLIPELANLKGIEQPIMHHPEGDVWTHVMMVVDLSAKEKESLGVRFASLVHDLGKGITPANEWPRHLGHEEAGVPLIENVCKRFKISSDVKDLAVISSEMHLKIHNAYTLNAKTIVNVLKSVDAFRRPSRFVDMLSVCEFDARGRKGKESFTYTQKEFFIKAFEATKTVKEGEIARECTDTNLIRARIHEARVSAVKKFVKQRSENE